MDCISQRHRVHTQGFLLFKDTNNLFSMCSACPAKAQRASADVSNERSESRIMRRDKLEYIIEFVGFASLNPTYGLDSRLRGNDAFGYSRTVSYGTYSKKRRNTPPFCKGRLGGIFLHAARSSKIVGRLINPTAWPDVVSIYQNEGNSCL